MRVAGGSSWGWEALCLRPCHHPGVSALQFAACHHGGSGIKAQSVLFLTTACQSTTSQSLKCDNNKKKQTARARTDVTAHGYLDIFLAPMPKASTEQALCHA